MAKVSNQFVRCDDYNPSVDYSNPIMEKWIHKDVVIITGKGEDDFVIDQKPVKIDEVNIQKSIQEEAKTTDLKALLAALVQQGITNPTGDEPELNGRPGFYGDITQIQESLENNGELISPEQIKSQMSEEFNALSVEQLATMSNEEILAYIGQVRASKSEEVKPEVQPEVKGE